MKIVSKVFKDPMFLSYRVSQKSVQYIRFREQAEIAQIAYQLTDIYLDILLTSCSALV
jgi:hypothetical protein